MLEGRRDVVRPVPAGTCSARITPGTSEYRDEQMGDLLGGPASLKEVTRVGADPRRGSRWNWQRPDLPVGPPLSIRNRLTTTAW